jgi:hypothetical protein
MIDHDRLFKELLDNFFPELIELFFPDISSCWEPNSIEFLPQEVFTDVTEGKGKIADLVVRASFPSQDALFIMRMFTYFARLHEKYSLPIYQIVKDLK